MSWSDKAVSPVVFTPGAGDAGGMVLDAGIYLNDGRLGPPGDGPEAISGCVLALYSSDYAINAGGTAVWTDKSGLGNHLTQTVEAQKPTLETYDGKLTVRTSSSNAKYLYHPNLSGFTATAEATVLYKVAHRSTATDTTQFTIGLGTPSVNGEIIGRTSAGGASFSVPGGYGFNIIPAQNPSGFAANGPLKSIAFSFKDEGAANSVSLFIDSSKILEDNTSVSSTNIVLHATKKMYLGAGEYGPTTYFTDINIFAFFVWNRKLSSAELSDAIARINIL